MRCLEQFTNVHELFIVCELFVDNVICSRKHQIVNCLFVCLLGKTSEQQTLINTYQPNNAICYLLPF